MLFGAKNGVARAGDAGSGQIDSRRAEMVAIFEGTEAFREMLKPLVELEVRRSPYSRVGCTGFIGFGLRLRTIAEPTVVLRTTSFK